jgi:hypothetical protein
MRAMKFVTLFGLRLRHDYYPDGVCRDLRCEPTGDTRRLLERYRLRLRELPDGIAVSVPLGADGKSALVALKRDEVFAFDLRARDADFALFTDLRELAGKADPIYTNAGLAAKDGGALKLAERKPARAADPTLLAGVELSYDKSMPEPGKDEAAFEIRFKARAARWAYYLVTDRTGDFSIVDSSAAAPAFGFSAANRTLLNKAPDETDPLAAALSRQYPDLQRLRFLSDQPVPCSSAARKGLELRLGRDKVLEAIPNPPVRQVSRVRQKVGNSLQVQDTFHQVVKYLKAH